MTPRYDWSAVQWPDVPFDLARSFELVGLRGSEAHGTYVAPDDPLGIDDRDIMGIVSPPAPLQFGLKSWTHTEAIKGPWDVVLYSVRKFVGLLMKQNPNVLCMLWMEPNDYLHIGPTGRALIDARDLFRCRERASASFIGYANGQFKRMTQFHTQGYMGAKRKLLVERFGYDTKNASHLIRILRMGCEFIETGELTVRRPDAEELVAIKRGDWALGRVRAVAAELFERARDAEMSSTALPDEIDVAAVDALLLQDARRALEFPRINR